MNLIDVVALSRTLCDKPIQAELKYATNKNFVGRIIDGYDPAVTDIALLTSKAAHSLCEVQNYLLNNHQLGLIVYDAYRPKRAVYDFLEWSKLPPASDYEIERKAKHYPHINKNQIFELGYLIIDSNHCYGNTVDLFLIDIKTNKPLEMGARFDFMDKLSHLSTASSIIGEAAFQHRQLLANAMTKFNFEPYPEEFWHFSHGGIAGREVSEPMDYIITRQVL